MFVRGKKLALSALRVMLEEPSLKVTKYTCTTFSASPLRTPGSLHVTLMHVIPKAVASRLLTGSGTAIKKKDTCVYVQAYVYVHVHVCIHILKVYMHKFF